MKIKLLFLILLAFSNLNAQQTSIKINFDNYTSETDNDLVKNFHSYSSLYKVVDNPDGIGKSVRNELGGSALETIKLCDKFKSVIGDVFTISVDYKYNVVHNNYNTNRNSVGIFLTDDKGTSFFSARIYESILYLGALNNVNDNSGVLVKEVNGKWHRLVLQITTKSNDKISCVAKVYDIGTDGKSAPVSVVSYSKEGSNYSYTSTDGFNVGFLSAQYGNVYCIDNLEISGYKSGSGCASLSIPDAAFENMIFYPNPTKEFVNIQNVTLDKATIFDSSGKRVREQHFEGKQNNIINLIGLQSGVYYLQLETNGRQISKKVIIE